MPSYRLHFIDRTGSVRRSVELDCEDDDQAILCAQDHNNDGEMELWRDNQRVARLFRTGSRDGET